MAFQVGDKVLVHRDTWDKLPIADHVARVSKTQVTLQSGGRYTQDGRHWGAGDDRTAGYIREATDEQIASAIKARRTHRLRNDLIGMIEKSNALTLDDLEAVAALLAARGVITNSR